MLSRMFVMRQAEDLSSWHDNSEEFYHDADISSYQDNLRSCAVVFFQLIFEVRLPRGQALIFVVSGQQAFLWFQCGQCTHLGPAI